jgi:hypothetical protein
MPGQDLEAEQREMIAVPRKQLVVLVCDDNVRSDCKETRSLSTTASR